MTQGFKANTPTPRGLRRSLAWAEISQPFQRYVRVAKNLLPTTIPVLPVATGCKVIMCWGKKRSGASCANGRPPSQQLLSNMDGFFSGDDPTVSCAIFRYCFRLIRY